MKKALARAALGSVTKIRPEFWTDYDPAEILKPLEWDEGVVHEACARCGLVAEISRRLAQVRLEQLSLPPDRPFAKGEYFEVQGCFDCGE